MCVACVQLAYSLCSGPGSFSGFLPHPPISLSTVGDCYDNSHHGALCCSAAHADANTDPFLQHTALTATQQGPNSDFAVVISIVVKKRILVLPPGM